MITVKATNIRCNQYPDGEQILIVADAGAWAWGKVKITDAVGKNDLQYSGIEQFLSEWTDIKFMGVYTNRADISISMAQALGAV